METWEKELVDMMKNSSETPDALLYRLRYVAPEDLDAIYNGTLRLLRLSGKAARVFALHKGDDAAAVDWIQHGAGREFMERRDTIRAMDSDARGRAIHRLAAEMEEEAAGSRAPFRARRVDWFSLALGIVYGKRDFEAVAIAPGFLTPTA